MNLSETLAKRGIAVEVASVSIAEHMNSDDTSSLTAMGIANDSFHWGLMEIVPPKNTVPVENPGNKLDKKNRKSKAFREYEQRLQLQQDNGPRPVMVQTTSFDNSDIMDYTRSSWMV